MNAKKLSPVLENYLEIIFLHEVRDGAVRASEVADAARVTRSTVTSALKTLQKMGFIEYAPYSLIHLTADGRKVGRELAHRHIVLQEFFHNTLQLDARLSSMVSCDLEHVLPSEVMLRLAEFLMFLRMHDVCANWYDTYQKEKDSIELHPMCDADLLRHSPHVHLEQIKAIRTAVKTEEEKDENFAGEGN